MVLTEVNSSSILAFTISDDNAEYYTLVGIKEWSFDRADLIFIFVTSRSDNPIEIPIKKGDKTQDILEALRQKLVEGLPVTANIAETFNEKVMIDIETQITDKLDKIHTTYFEEQVSLNPLVKHAAAVIKRNGDRKVTDSDIEFVFATIGKEVLKKSL